MTRCGVFALMSGLLLCTTACDQNPSAPRVVKLGMTANLVTGCVGHAAGLCGPEEPELRQMMLTAFASEPSCQGVQIGAITEKEKAIPVKDIPGYLDVFYEAPNQWRYQFSMPGQFLGSSVSSEREVVAQVCHILSGKGAKL